MKELLGAANMDKFVGLVNRHTISDATATGLKQYVASDTHLFVRSLFNRLKIPLKPWGAVKIARGVNVAGKALGAAGALVGVGLQAKDDFDSRERDGRESENHAMIVSEFNSFARKLEDHNEERLD